MFIICLVYLLLLYSSLSFTIVRSSLVFLSTIHYFVIIVNHVLRHKLYYDITILTCSLSQLHIIVSTPFINKYRNNIYLDNNPTAMENKRNRFIDDDGFSESSSLTHLLNGDDHEDCGDMEMITHSPYFTESDFHKLHSHKGNLNTEYLCQSIHAKFDEFRLFISRINKFSPIGAICLQETWTSMEDDIYMYQLPNYKIFHQGKICCKHGVLFIR